MNITEANATNSLLRWIYGIGHHVDPEVAVTAAGYLADQANKKLQAGIDHRHVDEAWNAMKDDDR